MTKLLVKNAVNFKLNSTSGKLFELRKNKSKYLVLYFYPKNDTPGCTLETKDFNSLLPKFKKFDCEIIGISKDNINSHFIHFFIYLRFVLKINPYNSWFSNHLNELFN